VLVAGAVPAVAGAVVVALVAGGAVGDAGLAMAGAVVVVADAAVFAGVLAAGCAAPAEAIGTLAAAMTIAAHAWRRPGQETLNRI
jgi:hypothetical protein